MDHQFEGADHQFYDEPSDGGFTLPPDAYQYPAINRSAADLSCSSYPMTPKTSDELCTHAMLEVWSGQEANRKKFIDDYKTVKNAGTLGVLGRIGWYANNEVLNSRPEFASFRGLRDANLTATHFRRPLGTPLGGAFVTDVDPVTNAPIGTMLSVPCGWTEYNEQIIAGSSLALRPRRTAWGDILTALDAARNLGESVLFYGWEVRHRMPRDASHLASISTQPWR